MRIHTNVLTKDHFDTAARRAGVTIVKCDAKGSKSRARAFDVALSGHGVKGGMYGNLGYPTATWDEWGMVLNWVFECDPHARIAGVYEGAQHFHWATGDRFTALTPPFAQYRHKWIRHGRAQSGRYAVSECKFCEAVNRWMMPGHTFDELVDA